MNKTMSGCLVVFFGLAAALFYLPLPSEPKLAELNSAFGYCNEGSMIKLCTLVKRTREGYNYTYEFSTDEKVPVRGQVRFTRAEWNMIDKDQFDFRFKLYNWMETGSGDVIFAFQIEPGRVPSVISGKNHDLPSEVRKSVALVDELHPLEERFVGAMTFYTPGGK